MEPVELGPKDLKPGNESLSPRGVNFDSLKEQAQKAVLVEGGGIYISLQKETQNIYLPQ